MGFPEGVSQKILMKSFDKYTFQHYKDTDHYKNSNTAATSAASSNTSATSSIDGNKNTSRSSEPSAAKKTITNITSTTPTATTTTAPMRPIGNGGLGPGYYWTQTLKEVTIHIDLDQGRLTSIY
jgi:hypothetical protein